MSKPPRTSHYVDVVTLYEALDEERLRRGISWNKVATECGGFSRSVFVRLAERDPDASLHADILVSLLAWLGRPVDLERFIVRVSANRDDEIVDYTVSKLVKDLSPMALSALTEQLSIHVGANGDHIRGHNR